MPKEYILVFESVGEKNPIGEKVEFDTVSLIRLELISDTNIFLLSIVKSTQKRRLLKISIYHFLEIFSLNTFISPRIMISNVSKSTSISERESESNDYETKN
jgi:hypothetical protein